MEETYKLEVFCKNCNFKGEIDLKKGLKVEEQPCRECGCMELKKASRSVILRPRGGFYL